MARLPRFALLFAVLAACADEPELAAAPEADASASEIAPSGTYSVEVTVLEDSCTPAHVAPPPWQARVLVQAEQGKAKVNLPLSMVSASGPSRATARSDFRLEQGYTATHTSTPRVGRDDSTIDATMVLTNPSPTGFAIETTLVDNSSDCTTRIAHTFSLVAAACAAECTRGEHPVSLSGGAPAWEIDCRC